MRMNKISVAGYLLLAKIWRDYSLECRVYYLHEGRGTGGGLMVPLQMASYK